MVLARNQAWEQRLDGVEMTKVGTLMLFDLSGSKMHWFQPAKRYSPTLHWQNDGVKQQSIGNSEIYVVNRIGVFFWTVLLVSFLVGCISAWSKRTHGSLLGLLCDTDGSLSLWRVQVAAWTVTIGGLVSGFGLTRLDVPVIPESLMALMGMSLGTAGVSHYQTEKKRAVTGVCKAQHDRSWVDLICAISADGSRKLSLPHAQMLFWTVLLLVIFITKSSMNGALWNVPWEMVALMGMSQAGYLTPSMRIEKAEAKKTKNSD